MSIAEGLATVKRRFGDRDGEIDRAFAASASLRTLCDDYHRCALAAEHWRASRSADAASRAAEYAELLVELTREIERALGGRATRAGEDAAG